MLSGLRYATLGLLCTPLMVMAAPRPSLYAITCQKPLQSSSVPGAVTYPGFHAFAAVDGVIVLEHRTVPFHATCLDGPVKPSVIFPTITDADGDVLGMTLTMQSVLQEPAGATVQHNWCVATSGVGYIQAACTPSDEGGAAGKVVINIDIGSLTK